MISESVLNCDRVLPQFRSLISERRKLAHVHCGIRISYIVSKNRYYFINWNCCLQESRLLRFRRPGSFPQKAKGDAISRLGIVSKQVHVSASVVREKKTLQFFHTTFVIRCERKLNSQILTVRLLTFNTPWFYRPVPYDDHAQQSTVPGNIMLEDLAVARS